MNVKDLAAYEIVKEQFVTDVNSQGTLLRHKKSGARIVLLENDDNNKVFYIGFRTPAKDSTGVAHIMEHTVLCGSAKFPIKDPFVELCKGSLNTFLNAMTYPDKTMYPVASCNDIDFKNLMDVYLDAVFHPNIYQEEKIFKQEGWHYELADANSELAINGVVYNEMKGVFSSPESVLDRQIFASLYPDTTYGNESGGDPEDIPHLTYQDYLDFHRRYYHPCNSYIYLYGDMDMAERLMWLDEAYLSQYEAIEIDSTIETQAPFTAPRHVQKPYSVTAGEDTAKKTYLSYNVTCGSVLDKELPVAMHILEYALCTAQGAPLKQALLDKGIGTDISAAYDGGIFQPYFSIVAANTDADREQEMIDTIEETLRQLVAEGISEKSLLAAINRAEFQYREADFGHYPKGLIFGLKLMDSWLYDEMAPFLHLDAGSVYGILRDRIGTGYFEGLIQTYFLDNPHKTFVSALPTPGLTARKDAEFKESLAAYKATLSDDEIKNLIAETKALTAYQEAEDAPEDLAKIPMLKREDLKKEEAPFSNELLTVDGQEILLHDIFTNGISYLYLYFDAENLEASELFAFGLLTLVLGSMDTTRHTYQELSHEIHIHTGKVAFGAACYSQLQGEKPYRLMLNIATKSLYGKEDKALAFAKEIIQDTLLTDKKRFKELLEEEKSQMESDFQGSGHVFASDRVASYYDPVAYLQEQYGHYDFYCGLCALLQDFDAKADEMLVQIDELRRRLYTGERILMDYTGTKEQLEAITPQLLAWKEELFPPATTRKELVITPKPLNEGFKFPGQVQFVCRGGNYKNAGLSHTGALSVLKVMMGYDYLWQNVRVKGGAYGCMSKFSITGSSHFVSYRDPNLKNTLDIYAGAPDYLRQFTADEREMTKYIIGTIGALDTPRTPKNQGSRSRVAYLSGITYEDEQKRRDEILSADATAIRALAAHVEAMLADGYVCVVGGEEAIEQERALFNRVENLLKD